MKSDGKLIGVNALLKNMGGCRRCLRFRRDAPPNRVLKNLFRTSSRRKPGPGKLCEVWIPVLTGTTKMGSLALFQQPVKEEISICGDGPRSNLMITVALVLLAGSLLLGTPAAAADVEAPKPSLAKLAQEFTDPLTTLPQIFTQNVYTPTNFGTDAPANRVIGRAIIPRVPESSLLPFVQLIRPSVSLVTVPTGTGSGTQTAFGDMQLFDLAVLPWPGRESGLLMGVGPVFVFPTATEKAAGQGAWQAGPAFGAIYKGIPPLIMGCLIQNPISFAYTSPDRQPVNTLLFQPIVALYLGKRLLREIRRLHLGDGMAQWFGHDVAAEPRPGLRAAPRGLAAPQLLCERRVDGLSS